MKVIERRGSKGCLGAAQDGEEGQVYIVGGGNVASVNDVIVMIREGTGIQLQVKYADMQRGDVAHTCADIAKARRGIGFDPKISLPDGLRQQLDYLLMKAK